MSWAPKFSHPPPGYRYGPPYRPSWGSIIRGIIYIGRGNPRSLAHDALYAVADMPVPPIVRGEDLIPERGAFVVVSNHYERPGLWMVWPALWLLRLIQDRTGSDTHLIAIEEWESFSLWGIPVPRALTRALFARTFQVYGILAMPAPYAPTSERAAALKEAARRARAGDILAMMPEGTVGPTPELLPAPEGVGTFLSLLSAAGGQILPAALYEEDEHLTARFGPPFPLTPPRDMSKSERDRWARDRAMQAIRDLLPEPLHGAYRQKTG